MKPGARFVAILGGLVAAGALTACKNQDGASAERCDERTATRDMELVQEADLRIHLDVELDRNLELTKSDVESVLARLWGLRAVKIEKGAPDFSTPRTVWLSTSSAAADLAGGGAAAPDGYVIREVAAPRGGGKVIVIHARTRPALAYGTYAFLEQLGARFFHPKESLVPSFQGIYLPKSIDVQRRPAFKVRGIQLHLLHPIEYSNAFNGLTDAGFAEAAGFIDWLVKTGQNHVQWPIMETMPLVDWKPHAARIIEYGHARGVTLGVVAQLFGRSSLQNNYVLIKGTDWRAELHQKLDFLLDLEWDQIELGLGEFVSADPDDVLAWLDETVAYVAARRPGTSVSVVNHVGNYSNLYLDYRGERTFFYQLPQYADRRLVNSVHTLFFFDLYRKWAMYGHEDFFFQRDYIFAELPKRPVRYFPESAYWLGADNDVPTFLPEYIHARWLDIHNLTHDQAAQGLPPIEGHVLFSSGYEWSYWMTDYLVAKMAWEPDRAEDDFLAHYAAPFGACATRVQADLRKTIDLETEHLFDGRLIGYLAGENLHYDLGLAAGFETHPMPIPFEKLFAMTPAELSAFESGVLGGLETLARELSPIEADLGGICGGATASLLPWCAEILDGVAIVRLRALHSASLYRAVLSAARSQPNAPSEGLKAARAHREAAQRVVARREPRYRFDPAILTGAYENPTIYKTGYLRQAHTLCYWRRREQQAEFAIQHREAASVLDLPTCLD